MIKILCNERIDENCTAKIVIKDGTIRAEFDGWQLGDRVAKGFDVLPSLLPYHSYVLILHVDGGTMVDDLYARSDCRWLDLNRLGVASRVSFNAIALSYGTSALAQVDTGVTTDQQIIRVFCAQMDKLTVESDVEYETEAFDPADYAQKPRPRFSLWDVYSLTTGGTEYKADCDGNMFSEAPTIPAADVIKFTIRKYTPNFAETLTRDIDNEEVFIDSSVGVVDNRRVRLTNGVGEFKLFTFGYTGAIKLKLGRKWYEVWDDYALEIEGDLLSPGAAE